MYVRKTLIIHKLTEINPFQRRSVNLKKMKFYIISYEATYPDDIVRLSIPNYKLAKLPCLFPRVRSYHTSAELQGVQEK